MKTLPRTDQQLIGLPDWVRQERYDIIATTGGLRPEADIASMSLTGVRAPLEVLVIDSMERLPTEM
jgi:hypothetical protein